MVSATTDIALRGNEEGLGWIVQKFGGTSVGKFPDKVCPRGPADESVHDGYLTFFFTWQIARDIVKYVTSMMNPRM